MDGAPEAIGETEGERVGACKSLKSVHGCAMNPFTIIRTLIAALVASMNTHSNNQQDLVIANAKIDDLTKQLADARAEAETEADQIAAEGDPLTAEEQAHLQDVLAQIAAQPAPVVPVVAPPAVIPPPPADPVTEPTPEDAVPADDAPVSSESSSAPKLAHA